MLGRGEIRIFIYSKCSSSLNHGSTTRSIHKRDINEYKRQKKSMYKISVELYMIFINYFELVAKSMTVEDKDELIRNNGCCLMEKKK